MKIGSRYISLEELDALLQHPDPVILEDEAREKIDRCRAFLDAELRDTDHLHYGINTGFGALCNIHITDEQIELLQLNLVRSHACGVGDVVPPDMVRLMLLLKIKNLSYGFSGIRLSVVERLLDFYNADVLPIVYELGSLGASGDLAPLAHLSLALIGEGEVIHKGVRRPATEVLQEAGWQPIVLASKEGLALLNGTQFSTAFGVKTALNGRRLWKLAGLCAALSLEAFQCLGSPFDERLQRIRPHQGQLRSAALIRKCLEGSELSETQKPYVQDPYAFRCVPQVHGASWDALRYVAQVIETEVNAVTDNPNIFPEDGDILSGGNFHAQPIALALDHAAIALAELGSISERRVFQLLSGQRGLPAFLAYKPGLHSGLMIPQYTAASMVSQNKQLCTPASVDSIVSSNGQEDHVSMAANAGTKAHRVVGNVERLLAIEWMTAAQAIEFRRPGRTSPLLEDLLTAYRKVVSFMKEDRVLSTDIERTVAFLRDLKLDELVELPD